MIRSAKRMHPVYIIVDILICSLIFISSYIFRYNTFGEVLRHKLFLPDFEGYCIIFIIWTVLIILTFQRRNLYITDRGLTIPREVRVTLYSIAFTGMIIAGAIFFIQYKFFSRRIFLVSFVLACACLSGWRVIKRLILRRLISGGFHNLNVLIVGAGKVGRAAAEEIRRHSYWGFNLVGFLDDDNSVDFIDAVPVLGKISHFMESARRYFIDEVIVSIPSQRKVVSEMINQAKSMRLGVRIIPDSFESSVPVLEISYLGIVPLLTYKDRAHHPAEFALKRIFDFLSSLLLLIFLLPIFVAIGIAIRIDSSGPVFYVRKRSGYKGKVFNFYKFRSMVKEADDMKNGLLDKNESKGSVIFKMKKDPRITKVGSFLRRYSLDELPQVINVLKGDMSLVGPRPFPVEESQKFGSNHMERLSIRPGITGLAQIRGRSDLSFFRWVRWDLWYINNWSFGLDLMILLRTIPTILKARGAY